MTGTTWNGHRFFGLRQDDMAGAGPQQPPGRVQRLETQRHKGSDKQGHLALRASARAPLNDQPC
jgi:hypothetical protein